MPTTIEDDLFSEIYYQGVIKRLKDIADARVMSHSYTVMTLLHRISRNPILSYQGRRNLYSKMKRLQTFTRNIVKKKSRKDPHLLILDQIIKECKELYGEEIFDVTTMEVHQSNCVPNEFTKEETVQIVSSATNDELKTLFGTNPTENEAVFCTQSEEMQSPEI